MHMLELWQALALVHEVLSTWPKQEACPRLELVMMDVEEVLVPVGLVIIEAGVVGVVGVEEGGNINFD